MTKGYGARARPVATVSRLLSTLVGDELVSHVEATGYFRLGPRLIESGNAALARVDIRERCRPHLEALTQGTGETATLSVPYRGGTIMVDFVQSPSAVRSVAEVGRPSIVPCHGALPLSGSRAPVRQLVHRLA